MSTSFDPKLAMFKGPGMLVPFRNPKKGIPLEKAKLSKMTELIVFKRKGEKRALLVKEMAYHHVAQGTLAGEPYLISF